MTKLDSKVYDIFGMRPIKGDVGLEIECEPGEKGKLPIIDSHLWTCHNEGSLRGGGIEYVFARPLTIKEEVPKALKEWEESMSFRSFSYSLRTSTHLHVNMSPYTVRQVYTILTAYWLVENILVRLQGPTREGNLFCLRMKDAENLLFALINDIRKDRHFNAVSSDNYRYSALNLASIMKFGSIEFRFMKCMTEVKMLDRWVNALFYLCEMAAMYPGPSAIINLYRTSPTKFFLSRFFLPEFVDYIYKNIRAEEINDLIEVNICDMINLTREIAQLENKEVKFKRPRIYHHNEDYDLEAEREANGGWNPAPDLEAEPDQINPWANQAAVAAAARRRLRPVPIAPVPVHDEAPQGGDRVVGANVNPFFVVR